MVFGDDNIYMLRDFMIWFVSKSNYVFCMYLEWNFRLNCYCGVCKKVWLD